MKKYLLVLLSILVLSACSALAGRTPESTGSGDTLIFEECQIGLGLNRLAAKCTNLEVYEDRLAQSGRKIALFIAVIPATSRSPMPDPLFFLAGGPGEAATEAYAAISGAFTPINLKRDIVLVDQRGTGNSHPLVCMDTEKASLETDIASSIGQCLQSLDADPRFYTTSIAMDDLDEVRKVLGYEQINLYGASYGTRAALVYARQYPAHVRSMTLDGVAPIGWLIGPESAKNAQDALDKIFARCASNEPCNEAFPDLEGAFTHLMGELPLVVETTDPLNGEPVTTTLSAELLALTVHTLTYTPETAALIPLLITQGNMGNLPPLAAYSLQREALLSNAINSGMYLSVVCSEDVPFFPDEIAQNGYLGSESIEQMKETCAYWPRGVVPAGYLEPVVSDVPTLLLSGEIDPVTPPENGETALKTLSNGRHLILPGQGHISILRGCLPLIVKTFIESLSPQDLDTACLSKISPIEFFVNFNGPIP